MVDCYFSNCVKYLRSKIDLDARVWLEEVSRLFTQMRLNIVDLDDLSYQQNELKTWPLKPKYSQPQELTKLLILVQYPVAERQIPLDEVDKQKIELGKVFADKLHEKYPSVLEVYITGSLLFGNSRYWSDVDLVIVHSKSGPKEHKHINGEVLDEELSKQYPFNPWIGIEDCYFETEYDKREFGEEFGYGDRDDLRLIKSFKNQTFLKK